MFLQSIQPSRVQEQDTAAVIIALIFEKKTSQGKRDKKEGLSEALAWKKKNLRFYETLLAELRLEDEYNYNILFTNDFSKLWRNILADKRRHKMREWIPPRR